MKKQFIEKANRVIAMANRADRADRSPLTGQESKAEIKAALLDAGQEIVGSFWASDSDIAFMQNTIATLEKIDW